MAFGKMLDVAKQGGRGWRAFRWQNVGKNGKGLGKLGMAERAG